MNIAIPNLALKYIAGREGLRLKAYPDPDSKNGLPWTIGYGHTKNVKKGETTTRQQAEKWLAEDLQSAAKTVSELVEVTLSEPQRAALISFVFNIGHGNFKKSTLLRFLNEGRYDRIPSELRRWVYNDGKKSNGLINRRNDEILIWNTPPEKEHDSEHQTPIAPNLEEKKRIDRISAALIEVCLLIASIYPPFKKGFLQAFEVDLDEIKK